jgi:manganese-dependent inorganic pyrophosphatase
MAPTIPSPEAASKAPTYIIGHKNPDADSICSAIAYAAFKEARGETGYIAARCGNSNARIDAILERFHTPLPLYLSDVSPRVHDMMTPSPLAVAEDATCAEALKLIDEHGISVLPVISARKRALGSLTLASLGHHFIPRLDKPRAMRQVRTSLPIVQTLKASVHIADETASRSFLSASAPMDIRTFWKISAQDNIPASQSLIIVGDRRDVQQRAIELGIRALIISGNLPVDPARSRPRPRTRRQHHLSARTTPPPPPGSCAPPPPRPPDRAEIHRLNTDTRLADSAAQNSSGRPRTPCSSPTTTAPCKASSPRATCSSP